jgi:hypothetical protein
MLFGKKEIPLFPWVGKESIYDFLKKHLDDSGKLPVENDDLPDAGEYFDEQKFRWIGGAMDSLTGGAANDSTQSAQNLYKLLHRQISAPTDRNRRTVYFFALKNEVIGYIDPLLEMIRQEFLTSQAKGGNQAKHDLLKQEAIWLATRGAHRGPVKLGIALLGLFSGDDQLDTLLILGKHDEFTLYSAVAIQNTTTHPNQRLFELAKCVDGWGKINLVERLEGDNDEIKDWLLRHGCRNRVMNEYLAYTCAVKGDLKAALEDEEIDSELYHGAGVIIDALINGGPAEDMDDYDQSLSVVVNFLRHSKDWAVALDDFLVIANIRDYLTDKPEKWDKRQEMGWTNEIRHRCQNECQEIMGWETWLAIVRREIWSKTEYQHYCAVRAGRVLNLDIWPVLFEQLKDDPFNDSLYYDITQTKEREKIKQVADFAAEHLPLGDVATGPEDESGLGIKFNIHSCLDFILQGLDEYEGVGGELVATALWSPVVRNRNMALKVLESWRVEFWPENAKAILVQLMIQEPREDVKVKVAKLCKRL